jgi:hypothetical protein
LVEEEEFVEEFGRDRDELTAATDPIGAPVDPEDVGHAEAFSFAPDEDGTGALDSLRRWYTCGGGGPTLSVSLKTGISSTGFIASASLWSKMALSFEHVPSRRHYPPLLAFCLLPTLSSSTWRITQILPQMPSQLWYTRSEALGRLSGCRQSMGVRQEAIASASSFG